MYVWHACMYVFMYAFCAYVLVLYCIYTFIWRFLQCTPIRSASSARDPERREQSCYAQRLRIQDRPDVRLPSPKPMMHFAHSPYFHKNYKFTPIFGEFTFFLLNLRFCFPPSILTMMHLCFARTGRLCANHQHVVAIST